MKKCWRKGLAFTMALSMLTGSFSFVYADEQYVVPVEDKVEMLAEPKYDEAVTFTDSLAFLENGNWYTKSTNYVYEDGEIKTVTVEKSVTAETNIVFMDAEGNKTVISNKDSNGETIFDAIYPMISNERYRFDAMKLIKDGKIGYIKADGTYYNGKLTYYYDAVPITNDTLFVSEDGQTYKILNKNGEVVVDNIVKSDEHDWGELVSGWAVQVGKYTYFTYNDITYVLDVDGNYVETYDETTVFSFINSNCVSVSKEGKIQLLDGNRKLIKEFDDENILRIVSYYEDYGYVKLISKDTIMINDVEYSGNVYKLINVETDEMVSVTTNNPTFDGEVIVAKNDGVTSVSSVDGTIYISDVDALVSEIIEEDSLNMISYKTYYVDKSFIISIKDNAQPDTSSTYVLTKDTEFKKSEAKKFSGYVQNFSYDNDYFITANSKGYMVNMCTIKGELVKSYTEEDGLKYAKYIYTYKNDGIKRYYKALDGYAFTVNVYSGDTYEGVTYIADDGSLGAIYDRIAASGNFMAATVDGRTDVLNSSYEVVYSGDNVSVDGYLFKDYFNVIDNGRVYLYNEYGVCVFGQDAEYTAICTNKGRSGSYAANDNDAHGGYEYYNYEIQNGMCITEVKLEDGTYKYGAVHINVVELGDPNGDDGINVMDAVLIKKYIAGFEGLKMDLDASDVNVDGRVNVMDAVMLLKYIAGFDVTFGA